MLPRAQRLDRASFDKIRRSPLVVTQGDLSLRFLAAPTPGRFSVVVPKSVAPSAVSRNTARRRVYESLSKLKTPLNGVFYLRKSVTFKALQEGVSGLVEKALKRLQTLK